MVLDETESDDEGDGRAKQPVPGKSRCCGTVWMRCTGSQVTGLPLAGPGPGAAAEPASPGIKRQAPANKAVRAAAAKSKRVKAIAHPSDSEDLDGEQPALSKGRSPFFS